MRTLPLIALGLCCLSASAQRYTILLDPARGGTEDGAHLDEHTAEKQATLDVANRLRALLNAREFNVVLTRETDVTATNDMRAAIANQAKPVACLLLHATSAGKGLHLFTSALPQTAPQTYAVAWDEAQAPFSERSQRLEKELSTAFGRAGIPVSSGHTWVRPLDNMQCPAVAIEMAPDADGTTAADHAYQNRIAETIAGALLFWRGHTDVMQSIAAPPPVLETKSAPPVTGLISPGKADANAAKPAVKSTTAALPKAADSTVPRPGATKPPTPKITADPNAIPRAGRSTGSPTPAPITRQPAVRSTPKLTPPAEGTNPE